jgi:hypothetical protein
MEATDEELIQAMEEVTFDGVSDEDMLSALQTVLPPRAPPPSPVKKERKTPRLMYSRAPSLATPEDQLRELLTFRKIEEDRTNGRGTSTNMACCPTGSPERNISTDIHCTGRKTQGLLPIASQGEADGKGGDGRPV